MAVPLQTGWTAASLLPSLVTNSTWSPPTPAVRPAKPMLQVAKPSSAVLTNRQTLLKKMLGLDQSKVTPPKQQDINPTVNSLSTVGYTYRPQQGILV